MGVMKKILIAALAALVLAGLTVVSYTLADSGALEGLNEKYNIFDMVDDSLKDMREMNVIMGEVRANVDVLNGKLDMLGETNRMLEQQLSVVDELNVLMAGQKPLLGETNASIERLDEKLRTTLRLVKGIDHPMSALIAAMESALSLTDQVVDGSAEMVGVTSYISSLFDQTLGYLGRIQPHSSKAKAYMKGGILDRLLAYLPRQQGTGSAPLSPSASSAPSGGVGGSQPMSVPVEQVVGMLEDIGDNATAPVLEVLMGLLGR